MASVFRNSDPVVEVGADRSFLLDAGGAWFVERGRVDIFCVRRAADGSVAERAYVARVAAGQCVIGCHREDAGGANGSDRAGAASGGVSDTTATASAGEGAATAPAGEGVATASAGEGAANGAGVLQAVGSASTKLRRLSRSAAGERFTDSSCLAESASLIDGWVDALYAGLTLAGLPRDCRSLRHASIIRLEPATRASSGSGVSWIAHREGCSRLLGRSELSMRAGPVPCSARAWFETEASSAVAVSSTQAAIEKGDVWAGLAELQRLAVRCALLLMDERAGKEQRRQQGRDAERRALLSDAFTELLTAHRASPDSPPPAGPPGRRDAVPAQMLPAACRLVGVALGMSLGPGRARDTPSPADPVAAIARASAVRVRRVLLGDLWWQSDSGPLLGRTGGDDKRWVALLPASAGRYTLCDPSDGARRLVTAEVASTLEPLAHTFYRSFPPIGLSLRQVLRFGVQGCRSDLLMVVALGFAGGVLGLVTPVATGALFNSIIPGAERDQLLQITLILLACAVATGMFELVRRLALTRVDGRMGAAVQAAVWDRLLSLPLGFFRPYSAGDLAVRAMGIDAMRKTLSGATITAALGGLFSLSNFILLFYYGGTLAWWATLLLAAAAGVTLLVGYGQLRLQRRIVPLRAKTSGLVLQLLTGISKIRVAAAEGHAFVQWARLFSRQRRLQFKSRTAGDWLGVFNALFPTLSLLVIMAAATAGGNAVPQIRTGDYVAFSAAFGACLAAMVSMSAAALEALSVVPIYESAKPILDAAPEINDAKGDPGALTGAIEAHHITFRYRADVPPALEDVSFSARPGEFVAVVGPSGSGKSTLLRVLLGFEQPDAGSVYFDGQDFARLDVQAVRTQIGVVLQSGRIMAGDLFTNIVGSASHTIEEAWDAARMAGLDDDIRAMPMGMHTVVSEGANTLSGGQRQRLLIARAIVNKPRLLFFDEATSALDNRTQATVSESLDRLNATRLVIAHRLSTIVNADRICVMQRGRIVQSGRYDELITQDGPFAELARRQTA